MTHQCSEKQTWHVTSILHKKYINTHANINGFENYQVSSEVVRVGMFYKTFVSGKCMVMEYWSKMFESRHCR